MAYDTGPSGKGVPVVPSETTTIGGARALYVGGGGNVVCDFADGLAGVVFTAVPVGSVLPIAPLRVRTATTATNIVALF